MSSAAEEYVIYQIVNAPMRDYPYPHIYVENIFPPDFYSQLRKNWPDSSALKTISETGRVAKGLYPDRFILPFTPPDIETLAGDRRAFWSDFGEWFMAYRFLNTVINLFGRYSRQRFGETLDQCRFEADSLIVRDKTNYALGPHTDAPHKLLSMLFYCPGDARMAHLGTSIYVPLDPDFRCKGGPHYRHKLFRKVTTMEYKPNSLFAFFKNDHSFHGVEPITDMNVQRDILLYDVRVTPAADDDTATAPASTHAGMGFRILQRLLDGIKK